jgi:asparagine synthase (glutamine-hydrolysing)
VALAEYIRYQQLLGHRTWFKGVSLFPAATVLRFHRHERRVAMSRYWDWGDIAPEPRVSWSDAVEECTTRFQRAVDIRVARIPRVGVFLSGGLDSRTIVGFLGGKARATTLTFGAPGCRDVLLAGRVADRAETEHHWFPLDNGRWVIDHAADHMAATEGFHGWHHAHGITVLESARALVDACLSGWDGGTILGGSINHYRDAGYRHVTERELMANFHRGFCRDFTWPGLSDEEADTLLDTPEGRRLRPLARDALETELAATRGYRADVRGDFFYINQVVRRSLQMQVVLVRSALPVACPFFDYRLIEFLYSLPEAIRTNPAFRKEVLTRRAPRLAAIPRDRDLRLPHTSPWRHRPHALAQRAKSWLHRRVAPIFAEPPSLYADYEGYLRHDLREWAEDLLLAPRTLLSDLVNPRAVRELWARHLSGRELWTIGKIAPLMTLELLLRAMPAWGAKTDSL